MNIELSNRQQNLRERNAAWCEVVQHVLTAEDYTSGEISVAIVDAAEMQRLNRDYLNHDFHTDVLSFVLDRHGQHIDGEIIASADMAIQRGPEFSWPADAELCLYLIHGALHLAGYDDKQEHDRAAMRSKERHYLNSLQIGRPRDDRHAAPGAFPS